MKILIPWSILLLQLGGCSGNSDHSKLKITNGREPAAGEYSSVVVVDTAFEDGEGARCSGTFITRNQILTSAHCVVSEKTGKPGSASYVNIESDKVIKIAEAVRVEANPKFEFGSAVHDLAVVSFAEPIAPSSSAIAQETPKLGTKVTLVGYGHNTVTVDEEGEIQSETGAGVKRIGNGTFIDFDAKDGVILLTGVLAPNPSIPDFEGKSAAIASGDSGGPL
ncbi:MAG TPA: trypsin-like serine protease [Oligoflexus sp.]|uniref:trypsin-like serine protease n=1 Tax=Oligoflexus sp. TaxID=1971216 RepID=UPI002D37CE6B|nr:trypsin-like serine protease [Oligoflexus sp.]HYX32876.1 trypsin-like serine protease [Oligoflexus sp.]